MGVLACYRNGCENIMCDYYSHTYGYLCCECMSELRVRVPNISVDAFMQELKKSQHMTQEFARRTALDFIDHEFEIR